MTRQRIGSYEVARTLGRGGMAVVYEVERAGMPGRLALKLLEDARPEVAERFRREISLLERLRDVPGVLRLVDSGTERGHVFLVAELLPGGTLEERLEAKLPRESALELLATVARTIHGAHELDVVHRDLKPANVLLDSSGRPHIADFGIASDLGNAHLTRTGAVLGTFDYMAPEQLGAETGVDRRTDVYALGAILYRILAGTAPFPGGNAAAMKAILVNAPQPPSRLASGVSPELEGCASRRSRRSPALDRPRLSRSPSGSSRRSGEGSRCGLEPARAHDSCGGARGGVGAVGVALALARPEGRSATSPGPHGSAAPVVERPRDPLGAGEQR